MQEALWTVDVSRANDIDHFKKPEDVYYISVSNERMKKNDCRVFLPFRYTRVRIQTPSTQMMLAILTSLVKNEKIKSISLEDDDADTDTGTRTPSLELVEAFESAVRILLGGKHLKMARFKIQQDLVIRDGQMLHDALVQSRVAEIDFGYSLRSQHLPYLSLATRTHPTLKYLWCYFDDYFLCADYFQKNMWPLNFDLRWPFECRARASVIEWPYGPKHRNWIRYQSNKSYLIYCMSHARVVSKLAMIRSPRCENIKFQGCDFSSDGIPDLTGFANIKRVYIIGCLLGDFESGDATSEREEEGEKAVKKRKRK